MTLKSNAKGMLVKLATLSCRVRHTSAACLYVRGVGVLVLMYTGLVACSYRSVDRSVLQAKSSVSETLVATASEWNGSPFHAAGETQDAARVMTTPLARTPSDHAGSGTHAVRTPAVGAIQNHVSSRFDDVAGDVLFTTSSRSVEGAPQSNTHRTIASDGAAPAPVRAMALGASLASTFHWGLLLGMVALVALGGLGLALALDSRRHRPRRIAASRQAAFSVDPSPEDDLVPEPGQTAIEAMPSSVSDDDAPPMMPAPLVTLLAEWKRRSEAANADIGPLPSSRIEWCYLPGKFDAPEQWAVDSPVDFLPASLLARTSRKIEVPSLDAVERAGSDQALKSAEPMESATATGVDASVGEANIFEHAEVEPASTSAGDDDPLSQLFDELERSATRESGDVPLLLVEHDSAMPQIVRTTGEPVPQHVLQTWESKLRQATADAHSLALPSLLISTLLLRADQADPHDAEALYAEAEEWIDLSMASDHERRAAWKARRIDVDLRRARRKKGAARLLWLRAMQAHYASQLAQGDPSVLVAWIHVLMFWAQCQFGDAALARYADAEAICQRLSELPSCVDAAQRCRADVLRQRATIEQGGARLHSLDTAQALADALYERAPTADHALAIAVTALARGNVLPPAQAKEAYSHALIHAFMAESDPRLREQALQCRLAVQWAYENLPDMGVQSDVALKLVERLEALRVTDPDTLQRMAQTYLRSADFARACECCEHAWRSGHATPALLSTWREACRQWTAVSTQPEQLVARQQTMRQLSIASAMR